MLTKMRWILIVTLVGVLTFFGCPVKSGDTISIISVTPDSGLIPGIVTDFVVVVEYELASTDSGEFNIGFNTDEVGKFKIISQVLVNKGSGQHQFNVTTVTKDWGIAGDFKVYVNLSEYPHGTSWTPLAADTRVLTF